MSTTTEHLVTEAIDRKVTEAGHQLVIDRNHYNGRVVFTAMKGLEPVGEAVAVTIVGQGLHALVWRKRPGQYAPGWVAPEGFFRLKTLTERVEVVVDLLLGVEPCRVCGTPIGDEEYVFSTHAHVRCSP